MLTVQETQKHTNINIMQKISKHPQSESAVFGFELDLKN